MTLIASDRDEGYADDVRAAPDPVSATKKQPIPAAYIFFIVEHFTNLPFASRQCLGAGAAVGHLVNFP